VITPCITKHEGERQVPLITVTAGTPAVKPGTYPATLVGVTTKPVVSQYTTPPGQTVDMLEWTWLVEGPEKDVEITTLSSFATTPKSNLMMYLVALMGADKVEVDAGFEEGDLVGKRVMVTVVTKDDGFAKIDKVVAAPAARRTAPTATTKPARAVAPVRADTALDALPVEEEGEEEAPEDEQDDLPF
jgi:hypothetical protein